MADSNYTGRRIKEERKKLGLSQSALAQRVNCVKTAVSRWETGSGYPDIETIEKLAEIFGVTIDSLINEKEEYVVDNVVLELKNVRKTYKRKKTDKTVVALDSMDLSFGNKGIVFILGKSGSGKSTLLNVIGGLDSVDEGEILFCGEDISKLSAKELDEYRNDHVGFVFQEYNLFDDMTVAQNVSLAMDLQNRRASDEEISDLLEKFDLRDIGSRKPNTLSGGQKQRVAIARALIKNSEIILADEPTGALDSDTAKQIFDYIKTIAKDKLVIVVSHDKNLANAYADRIIELKDGVVVGDTCKPQTIAVKQKEERKNKSRLSLKNAFRLGASMFSKKRGRLAFSLIMIIASLVLFGLADTFSAFEIDSALAKSFEKSSPSYFSVEKTRTIVKDDDFFRYEQTSVEGMDDTDVEKLTRISADAIAVYNPSQSDISLKCFANSSVFYDYQYPHGYNYYKNSLNGFVEFSESDVQNLGYSVNGRLPQNYDEIAISRYVYEMFTIGGYRFDEQVVNVAKIPTEADFLALEPKVELLGRVYSIVGVVDTKFDTQKYDISKGATATDDDYKLALTFDSYVKCGLHGVAFVKSGHNSFVESAKKEAYCTSATTVQMSFTGFSGSINARKLYDVAQIDSGDVAKISENFTEGVVISYADAMNLARMAERSDILDAAASVDSQGRYAFAMQKLCPFLDGVQVKVEVRSSGDIAASKTYPVTGVQISDDAGTFAVISDIYRAVKSKSENYTRVFFRYTGSEQVSAIAGEKAQNGCDYSIRNEVEIAVSTAGEIIGTMGKIFALVSVLALLLAVAFASNVIVSFVNDKVNVIGVLRAMGGSTSDVYGIFATQSGMLLSIAFAVSVIATAIVDAILNFAIGKPYGLSLSMLSFGFRQFGIMLATAIAITLLATLVPILLINRKKPAELIRIS